MLTPLLTLLLAMPTAEAGFDGKIRNVRIRERGNSQGYRVIVVVKDDVRVGVDPTFGEAEIEMDFLPEGEAPGLEGVTFQEVKNHQVAFDVPGLRAEYIADDGTSPLILTVSTVEGEPFESFALNLPICEGESKCGWTEVSFGEGSSVKARYRGEDGGIDIKTKTSGDDLGIGSVFVSMEDGTWTTGEGEGVSGADGVFQGQSWRVAGEVATDADLTGLSYQVETRILDADGIVQDFRSEQMEINAEGADDGFVTSKLKARNSGGYRLVTITSSSDAETFASNTVEIYQGDEVVYSSEGAAPVNVGRDFSYQNLSFDGSIYGSSYPVTLSFLDEEGFLFYSMQAYVEGVTDEEGTQTFALDFGPEDTGFEDGLIAFTRTDDSGENWDLAVALTGDQAGSVASVELTFDEPFDGPVPQENPIELEFDGQVQKFVDTFETPVDLDTSDLTYIQTLITEEGEVLEEIQWTGPVGAVYKSGKGTRSSASNTSTSAKLL